MENFITEEMCQNCARCCRDFPFVEVSALEITKLEKYTGLTLLQFTNPKGKEAADGYFLQSLENGNCLFLGEKDGHASCTVYEVRPDICKAYPINEKHQAYCESVQNK
ncbi:MAG: YkgJ family cysteine cluster protein [Marinilabiliaceae bacterium]|nr:YkgJ family cysteine cluster protein [Marinilabiliaceae bacterium]